MTTPQITLSKFTVFFDKLFITFSILRKCAVKSQTYSPPLRRSLKTIPPNAPFGPPLSPLPLPVLSYFNQVSSWQSSQLFFPTNSFAILSKRLPTNKIIQKIESQTRRQMKAQCHNYRISPIIFLLLSQWYFPKCVNCISPNESIVFLLLCQLYFSKCITCISPTVPTVFLLMCQLYFSLLMVLVGLGSCVSWCGVSSAEWMMGPATAEHPH